MAELRESPRLSEAYDQSLYYAENDYHPDGPWAVFYRVGYLHVLIAVDLWAPIYKEVYCPSFWAQKTSSYRTREHIKHHRLRDAVRWHVVRPLAEVYSLSFDPWPVSHKIIPSLDIEANWPTILCVLTNCYRWDNAKTAARYYDINYDWHQYGYAVEGSPSPGRGPE